MTTNDALDQFGHNVIKSTAYLPATAHTKELIEGAIKGNLDKVFALYYALGDAVLRYRKSTSPTDLNAADEATELMNKIMEAMQFHLEKEGHSDLAKLVQKGRKKYSQYIVIKPIIDKLKKWGLIILGIVICVLIYNWD